MSLTKQDVEKKLSDLAQKINQRAYQIQQADGPLQALLGQQLAWVEVLDSIWMEASPERHRTTDETRL